MSTTVFEFTGMLGASLSPTTNPDPNTLSTANPYPATPAHTQDVAASWTSQTRKALFPDSQSDCMVNQPLALTFIPSGGASITYTLTIWKWDGNGNWIKPSSNATRNYTGAALEYLENPGRNPWFIQINSISAGTLAVRYDEALATAL